MMIFDVHIHSEGVYEFDFQPTRDTYLVMCVSYEIFSAWEFLFDLK